MRGKTAKRLRLLAGYVQATASHEGKKATVRAVYRYLKNSWKHGGKPALSASLRRIK